MRNALLVPLIAVPLVLVSPRVVAWAFTPEPEQWEARLTAGWAEDALAPAAFTDQRALNPEYDLMARTFTVLALADRALAEPARAPAHAATMDAILADTLDQTQERGHRHWLLPYADARPWVGDGRSLFVDGELLVMLGARRLVADDDPRWRAEMARLAPMVVGSLGGASALPLAESYPDEGWTFCHTMALVGLRMHEVLDGAEYGDARQRVVSTLRRDLADAETGLLVSEFDLRGGWGDGPEGSSLWFAATALRVVDPGLAAEQYAGAREELGRSVLGLGYAREWPAGAAAAEDVDSGPLVPILEASASSSGMALAASRAFGDDRWNGQLVSALGAAEAVLALDPALAETADTPVGRAVLWWAMGIGPVWDRLALPAPGQSAPAPPEDA